MPEDISNCCLLYFIYVLYYIVIILGCNTEVPGSTSGKGEIFVQPTCISVSLGENCSVSGTSKAQRYIVYLLLGFKCMRIYVYI